MFIFLLILFLIPFIPLAHCPFCVAGTGVLVIAGYELGFKKIVLGLF